jgi:hypothetical protein
MVVVLPQPLLSSGSEVIFFVRCTVIYVTINCDLHQGHMCTWDRNWEGGKVTYYRYPDEKYIRRIYLLGTHSKKLTSFPVVIFSVFSRDDIFRGMVMWSLLN